jgi:hypothetical protein
MRVLGLSAILIMALTGCSSIEGSEEPVTAQEIVAQPIEEPAVEEQPEETPAEEPYDEGLVEITERYIKDGKMQSYLTGEWKDAEVVQRRPMAVMIPNNKAALPQYGISKASVIYEAPMEAGSCTRLMGIFEDYDELEYIGPIRSSRLYFIHESMSFDAIYCNWGLAVPYVAETINSDKVDNISAAVSGIESASDEAFSRSSARKAAGYATEYTGIMTISGYEKAVTRHEYETQYPEGFQSAFRFVDDGVKATYDEYADATVIRPGGSSTNSSGYGAALPSFEYDPATGKYTRHQFGSVMKDEYNGEEITVDNVILKVVKGGFVDANGYLGFDCYGIGPAYIFTNGKVMLGWWTRDEETYDSKTVYFAEGGKEVVLNQGKTWVCLVWGDYENLISYE